MFRSSLRFATSLFVIFAAASAFAQSSDVGVFKNGPSSAAAGTDVSYDILVTNTGPDDAGTVSLTDLIPSGMTFVSFGQNNGPTFVCSLPNVGAGGSVDCSAPAMLNGTSADFTITLHIPANATSGTTYVNMATVSTANDPNSENDTSSAGTTVPSTTIADLSVVKTAPAFAPPNTNVTFTITLTNLGPNDATSVTLNDTLGAGLTFVSFTQTSGPTFTCPGSTTPCTISTFPNGSTATFNLVATTPASPGAYTNTASVTSFDDENPENNSSLATVTVSSADVGIVKSGPATAVAGNQISYTVTITNNGPDEADSITMSDTFPAGVTFVAAKQTSGPIANCTPTASNGVTCVITSMLNGQSSVIGLTGTLDPNLANGTNVTNTATITTGTADTNPNNNTSSASTTISTQADLAIVKSGPASATAGTNATYTVTVTNNGPSTATGTSWTDTLPPATSFVSVTQNSGPAFTCGNAANVVTCSGATMTPGSSAVFTLVASISSAATGTLSNTATVTSAATDTTPANNSSTAVTTLVANADLSVAKTATVSTNVGGTITWTINVSNPGPSDAAGVTLTDVLPPNTTFVSENQTSGPTFNCTTGATVTCTAATFAAGATASFTITATANASGMVTNTATVTSTTPDSNPANNTSSASTSVSQSADLAITKSGPASTSTGANVAYTITVTNNGPNDASNVTLTDVLPANTTFVSMTQTSGTPFTCGGTTTVTCTAPLLANGTSAAFTLTVTVGAGLSVSNTATISAATPDLNPANNSSTATTPVAFGPAIPALSPLALAMLGLMLAAAAMIALKR